MTERDKHFLALIESVENKLEYLLASLHQIDAEHIAKLHRLLEKSFKEVDEYFVRYLM